MNRPIVSVLGLLAIGATLCSCGTPDSVDGKTQATPKSARKAVVLPPPGKTYEVLGVVNGLKSFMVQYDRRFYRGGEPISEAAAESLKKVGVTTIISVVPTDGERAFAQKYGFKLVEIPFQKPKGPSVENLRRFLETVRAQKAPFYVHCHGGTHRGGVLGVAYRIHVLDWPYERALVEFGRLGGSLMEDDSMLEAVRAIIK